MQKHRLVGAVPSRRMAKRRLVLQPPPEVSALVFAGRRCSSPPPPSSSASVHGGISCTDRVDGISFTGHPKVSGAVRSTTNRTVPRHGRAPPPTWPKEHRRPP